MGRRPRADGFSTKANYKNVNVTVSRARDAKVLTVQSTQVGPRQRAAFGGINLGIVNAQVLDYYYNTPFTNTVVNLNNGPSSPSDGHSRTPPATSGSRRSAPRPARPTTTWSCRPSTATSCCRIRATTHFQLAAGSTPPTKILQMYRPVTLTVNFNQSSGPPFVGTVVFTVANSRGSKSYTYTGTPVTVTTITNSATGASELLVPGTYTITVTNSAASVFYSDVLTQDVPSTLSSYPGTLTAGGTLAADPLGTISASVTSAGGPVVGATVTVGGGPRSIPTQTVTTNSSGIANFPGPPGRLRLHGDRGQGRGKRSEPVGLGQRRIDEHPHVRLPDGASEGQGHVGRRQPRRAQP